VTTVTGSLLVTRQSGDESGIEGIELPASQPLGLPPERSQIVDDGRAALPVAKDVEPPTPTGELEPEVAEHPVQEANAQDPAPPTAVLLGPVLAQEGSAEGTHVACFVPSRQARELRDSEGGGGMAKEIFCAFGVDVDAVAGWLGSYGGEDSPDDISRGLFAGEVGTPRLLALFERYGLKTTWFIPGHSIETFPEETRMVAEAGHEIGMHGYSHENPIAMTPEQEEAVLLKCIGLIEEVWGRRPTGYVAPWWEFSRVTNELLLKHGIKYDHSLMHRDFEPYYVRVGDSWTKIDYSREAEDWMKPLVRGEETDLIEIPASWYVDDLPPMMFIKASPNSHGFVNPRHLEESWRDQFDWVYREMDYAVFTMTIHPDVSGRPQVLLMLERLIEHMNEHDGVRWATFDEIADDFAQRRPREARAVQAPSS
jgi:peptidoglycan/xylan/chitin deacetylase (PgdA/CDA1 family)